MRSSRPAPETDQLLTLTQIARHFSLPESTARYYCKRFAPFMPCTGEGRRRRYRQEALGVIAAVIEHMRTERTASGVEEALTRQFPRQMDALVPLNGVDRNEALTTGALPPVGLGAGQSMAADFVPVMAMKLLEQQTKAMEGIAASLEMLTQRQDDLRQLSEQARQVSEENKHLRQELENLRVLQHSSEKIQQADLEQIRTWVTRMARRNDGAQISK